MKQRNFLTLAVVSLALACAILPANGATPLKPLNGKKVPVRSSGKDRIYHLLSPSEPVKLAISGPVRIEIITRLILPKSADGKSAYSIDVSESGKPVKTYKTSSERSKAEFTDFDGVPAKRRRFSLNVPEGEHTFAFAYSGEQKQGAVLRFMLSTKKNLAKALQGKSVRIEPLAYDRVATAVISEKLITYFVSSKAKQVELRVVGPSKVVVEARLNFDPPMVGKQSYKLMALEGTKTIGSATFSATRSVDAYYKDWKEVVPGKINSLSFAIPEGEHRYKFTIGETLAKSVSLKFSIPAKDVGNEQ